MNIQLLKYVTLVPPVQVVTDGTQSHVHSCYGNGENQLLLVMR